MKNINISSKVIYKVIAVAAIIALVLCLVVSCGGKKNDPESDASAQAEEQEQGQDEEQKIEYKANSPLGVAESYIGKDIKDLIQALGTLKGEPTIAATKDGGGYEGIYEFDGFTAYTYAKSEKADAIVTDIVPDENSKAYKESIKTENEGSSK